MYRQAERQPPTSTLIPDADNAVVGSLRKKSLTGGAGQASPVFWCAHFEEVGNGVRGRPRRAEGERPESGITAMGSRVPA